MTPEDAVAEIMCLQGLGGVVIDGGTPEYAIQYATHGYEVFPLRPDKTPATIHGCLDATSNLAVVIGWWQHREHPIGIRIPADMIVVDVDPRNGGEPNWRKLTGRFGTLPETQTAYSGRGDGGRHYYLRRPNNDTETRVTTKHLKTLLGVDALGVDVKTHTGYVVAPPSLHPATGRPYRWENYGRIAVCPPWLWARLTAEPAVRKQYSGDHEYDDSSPADWFTAHTTWNQILEPHGWCEIGRDTWKHPAATSVLSATVRHELLFVYSPNTPFDVTESGDPHGYTRFRAWAVLNHGGDLTAAAVAVAKGRQ